MKKRRKELSSEQRGEIIGAYRCGTKPATIARTLGFIPSTVYDTISRYKRTSSAQTNPRPGRPQSLGKRGKRVVRRTVLKGRFKALAEITDEVNASLDTTLCEDTVRKYIAETKLSSRVACEKPFLRKETVKARLQWCKEHQAWDEEWKKVVFSDESPFHLFHNDKRVRVWRGTGERYRTECLKPTMKFGGGSVMVWGCMSWSGVGPLVVVDGTLDQNRYISILSDHAAPYLKQVDEQCHGVIFQDDNAPCHAVRTRLGGDKRTTSTACHGQRRARI